MRCELLSKYRKALLGIATLWIALLHAQMWFSTPLLQWIKITGHGGVEMFLFLSSLGLYYAWEKGERGWPFFRRRLLRILPYFIPIAIFRVLYLKPPAAEVIPILTATSFWLLGDRTMWYISGILVLYALTPLYLSCFQGREGRVTAISVGVSLAASALFLHTEQTIFTASVPCYLLGFYAGYCAENGRRAGRKQIAAGAALLLAGLALQLLAYHADTNETVLYGLGMYWYPFVLMVWPLCMSLAWLLERMEQSCLFRWAVSAFNSLGAVSLEYYLLHELMIQIWGNVMHVIPQYRYHGILMQCVIMLLTYNFAWLWQRIWQWIPAVFHSCRKGKQA